jgi:hypothetical protein
MTRKPRNKKREKWNVNDWRGHNYMMHFEKHAYVQALPENVRKMYQRAGELIPCPKLNIWGVGEFEREQERFIFSVNRQLDLDIWYLNPWYCTDAGWSDFQKQWQQLPELVSSPCIPIADVIKKASKSQREKVVPSRR